MIAEICKFDVDMGFSISDGCQEESTIGSTGLISWTDSYLQSLLREAPCFNVCQSLGPMNMPFRVASANELNTPSSSVFCRIAQIPRSTPAWDTFGFIPNVVTKFCKADPG